MVYYCLSCSMLLTAFTNLSYCVINPLTIHNRTVKGLDNILRELNVEPYSLLAKAALGYEEKFALYQLFGLTATAKHWQYSFQTPHNDSMF